MGTPYLGEIRIFTFNFAPKGWALCHGQVLAIQQNQALFSLLGTTYGGNGVTTFQLPDLRGRVATSFGGAMTLGEAAGAESVTLLTSQVPVHTHTVRGVSARANTPVPTGAYPASDGAGSTSAWSTGAANATMAADTIGNAGGSQPHSNMQPYTVVSFCIALQGIFPSRN